MPKLSVIIPVYNEEETVGKIIERVKRLSYNKEIIVVNDGSTDWTLDRLSKIKKIKLISYMENKGKGYAVRQGLKKATGDIFIIQDADLEYPPEEIPKLINPIINKETETDVVYGNRFNELNNNWVIPHHYIGNKILTFIANIKYGYKLSDVETGFKVFNKKVKDNLNLSYDDFRFEIDFLINCRKNNFKIIELPIKYYPRTKGKKINWIDGIKALMLIIKSSNKK